MPEAFLILLAGGVLLAAAVSDPRQVTLNWLRLAGIIALSAGALAVYFVVRREAAGQGVRFETWMIAATIACVLAQLAFAQVGRRRTQRVFAAVGFAMAVLAGT